MGHILGLKFSDYSQVYYFESGAFVVNVNDYVIVKTDQGMGLGSVVVVPDTLPEEFAEEELKPIFRVATEHDLKTAEENSKLSRQALKFCKERVRERKLEMKLVDVEVFFDRGKIIFYFTAPGRVDFRELVKDLVRAYKTRIELRQIGVRHETQMIGAVGNCGQVACCRRFMRKFAPVTIKMAKEQNLFLNPTKISGICGRLLCCLSFEEKNYEEFYRKCPKIGKRMDTDDGILKVLRANFFRGSIAVLSEFGEERELTLEEWEALNPRRIDPLELQRRLQEAQAQMRSHRGRGPQHRPAPKRAPKAPEAKAEKPESSEPEHEQPAPEKRQADVQGTDAPQKTRPSKKRRSGGRGRGGSSRGGEQQGEARPDAQKKFKPRKKARRRPKPKGPKAE
ncbi:PSP1 domain-containing protein [Desulfobaculum bizertense]|uniref:Cell fate regulator YaaT, PSP1 superfamily (Controls sporulation, competence, biofilm development) n=1 Tax=Desulfobaculum bizertense DSM 18034 TaxID=1121442 RepID=A0A1T4WFE9_9BACT|nr:regulatory iron-sulfur-containing complex subunit RicT [Desulfobaculum bizertense]UIJ36705.1 hypothetical protein LWC08_08100 [Desulfobaculum bizertense]SKA75728.1 Cell fate regulator YaaT, PSP1 superfamily (controls sporulation, competence, biofilm development) [Desulfobaculum bizertense DSM 18034]